MARRVHQHPPCPTFAEAEFLLADDDVDFRQALASALRADGFEVVDLPTGVGVSVFLDECAVRDDVAPPVDAVVTDLRMPDVNGLMLLEQLAAQGHPMPAIVVTAFDDVQTRRAVSELGAAAFLAKPFSVAELEGILERVTHH